MKWLMVDGQCCPECGGNLESARKSIRDSFKDFNDFVYAVELLVEIEDRWKLTITDDETLGLPSLNSVCHHICNSLNGERIPSDFNAIRDELITIAAKILELRDVSSDFDPFTSLRIAFLKRQAHSRELHSVCR